MWTAQVAYGLTYIVPTSTGDDSIEDYWSDDMSDDNSSDYYWGDEDEVKETPEQREVKGLLFKAFYLAFLPGTESGEHSHE